MGKTKTGKELTRDLRWKFLAFAILPLAGAIGLTMSTATKGLKTNSDRFTEALELKSMVFEAHAKLIRQDEITRILLDNPDLLDRLSSEKISSHDQHIQILRDISVSSSNATIKNLAKWLLDFETDFLRKVDTKILEELFDGKISKETNDQHLQLRGQYDGKMNDILLEAKENVFAAKLILKEENQKTINTLAGLLITSLVLMLIVYFMMERSLKHSQDQLFEEKSVAENFAHNKAAFLANMSHEIRTPLNGILGITDILADMKLETKPMELVKTVQRSGYNLKGILDDILDLSKLDSGQFDPEITSFNLPEQLQDTISLFRGLAYQKQVNLKLDLNSCSLKWIKGPQLVIHQIVNNFVSNAIKFSDGGEVTINVTHSESTLNLTVKDTGIGIPKDKLENIFDEYQQAESSTTRKYGGTGLGLSICKRLSDAVGGKIQIESIVNIGTAITFEIQIDESAEPTKDNDQLRNVFPELTVLVAEDNDINQLVIKNKLKKMQITVDIVKDGSFVMEALGKKNYDLVFMDCFMPKMDGFEATVLAKKKYPDLPIYALSASTETSEKVKARESGMDGFLSKPVRDNEIIEVLAKIRPKKRAA